MAEEKLVTLKTRGAKVEPLLLWLKRADIKDKQVLEFSRDRIFCKGHPADKTYVNFQVMASSEVGDLSVLEKTVRFPLNGLKKLVSVMDLYKSRGVMEVGMEFVGTDEGTHYQASHMQLSSKGMNVKISSAESYLVPYMEDRIWTSMSKLDGYDLKFALDDGTVAALKKLIGLYTASITKEAHAFRIRCEGGELTFLPKKDEDWSLPFGGAVHSVNPVHVLVGASVIELLSAKTCQVYVRRNESTKQPILTVVETNDSIFLSGVINAV